ncbi:tetraspanin-15-like [Cynara cardunculus var. scolymus]|uniref:Tetraspanin/Peripherin n=1 Tax=Cynara cardunculus var. scolymus TaxID=59895 RepID=A0A103XN25_CYNCS|nr:tetraspanin-15-like [Cynara cardunculus var. scolymus]KVH93725.1 Tetraspanin/Peripherin [Cynara cardunculus var. scolymus]
MAENANPIAETTQDVTVVAENRTTPNPAANKKHDPKPSSVKRIMFPLTTISFLLSFPILFCIVWLLYVKQCNCEHLLPLSKLQHGVVFALILLFVVSNSVVFLRSRFLMLGLIVVMVPLIVILTIGLALVGSYTIESRMIPGSPSWLKMMVNDDNNWYNIETCIYNTRTCQDLAVQSIMIKSYDFSMTKLSPIESGCCIPPTICDMEYLNATYWIKKTEVYDDLDGPYDIDCDLWQNNVTKLCYDCYACRKGFINTLRQKWYKLGVFLVVVTILLIVSHLLLFVASMQERYAS